MIVYGIELKIDSVLLFTDFVRILIRSRQSRQHKQVANEQSTAL